MKKHITSIIVFFVNLILMGVGFLFIKQGEEAKKNNLGDENVTENTIDKIETGVENAVETLVNDEPSNVTSDTKNIPSSTAPVVSVPKTTTNNKAKSSAKTKTS